MNPPPKYLGRGTVRRRMRKHGPTYELRYMAESGKQVRVVLKNRDGSFCRTNAQAEKARAVVIFNRDNGHKDEVRIPHNFHEALAAFMESWGPTVSKGHASNTARSVERVFVETRSVRVSDLTRPKILQWRDERRSSGASAGTCNRDIAALRSFFGWLELRDYVDENPLKLVKDWVEGKDTQTRPRRAFTEQELELLWPAMREVDDCNGGHPLEWPVYGLWALGCRHAELTALEWRDVDFKNELVTLREGTTKGKKGRKRSRRVQLTKKVAPGFLESLRYMREAQSRYRGRLVADTDRVFWSRRRFQLPKTKSRLLPFINEAMDRAGIEKRDSDGRALDIHSFRTTFVTRCLRAGIDVVTVSKMTGHRSIDTLLRHYEDLGLNDEKVRAACESAPIWAPYFEECPQIWAQYGHRVEEGRERKLR